MNISYKIPQLLLRLSLGVGFITPVLDRLGFLGSFGKPNIEWGGWERFIDYTGTLMPFLDRPVVNVMGILVTTAEISIGILLIIGLKTKIAAIGSCLLTLVFILAMTVFIGIKAPINFAVFTTCSASLLLAAVKTYEWSIDNALNKKKTIK